MTGWAELLNERGLSLHLEPGRSLFDGCGRILAEVAFVKTRSDGLPLVGLVMNRTQCLTTSDDYLIDPIHITEAADGDELEAYLVGAYCIEDELILRRRIRFPRGVKPGDLIGSPTPPVISCTSWKAHPTRSRWPGTWCGWQGDSMTSTGRWHRRSPRWGEGFTSLAAMNTLTPRLRRAINTASVAHRDHVRKGSGIPYITHLFSVMYLLRSVTDDEDVLIAGLLHDTLEDVPEHYSAKQLEEEFGPRVLGLVRDLTKDDSLPRWKDRSDSYLAHLEHHADRDAVLISLADKTHNLMSILDDLEVMGERLWDRFNSTREENKWWYAEIRRVAVKRVGVNVLTDQLGELVARLRAL